jgi:hypothetical protein
MHWDWLEEAIEHKNSSGQQQPKTSFLSLSLSLSLSIVPTPRELSGLLSRVGSQMAAFQTFTAYILRPLKGMR